MVCQRDKRLPTLLIALLSPILLVGSSGCAILNGFLDPTKVGQFGMPGRESVVGIRRVLSVREGSSGIPSATDPTPEDLIPIYEDYRIQSRGGKGHNTTNTHMTTERYPEVLVTGGREKADGA